MNIIVFRRLVRSRKECKLYETKPIGSAIKFKRKAMNMTLEEGSEGICSVSYLSKIENEAISITPCTSSLKINGTIITFLGLACPKPEVIIV